MEEFSRWYISQQSGAADGIADAFVQIRALVKSPNAKHKETGYGMLVIATCTIYHNISLKSYYYQATKHVYQYGAVGESIQRYGGRS